MTTHFAVRPLRLKQGELIDVRDGQGLVVNCLEGSVWITQANDARDIVLDAGEAFMLDKPGLALVCAAAGAATVAIEASPRQRLPAYRWGMRHAARWESLRSAGL
jgi:DUF2917 family protein